MGLLDKRPLALFCMCFLSALYVSSFFASQIKIVVLIFLCALAVIPLILTFLNKKKCILWITLTLCILAVIFGFLHMYIRIDRREEKALDYTGTRTVECQVLSEEYVSDGHSEYVAELLGIGEERVRIRTYLVCGFSADLHAGDRLVARVELLETDQQTYGVRTEERVSDSRILLTTVLHDADDGELTYCADTDTPLRLLSSPNGLELLSDRIRTATADAFDRLLGDEISPLARSFFVGDKDDLSARVIRDFRRTGTSHLLAVSGLHITVLLGGLEWLLRKLTLPKGGRIVCVSLAGILLLMLTGFSMSACRSVLMLFAIYLHYLFAKENDALTSLLVAVSLILIVSADAFFDLGLWMSFFATLGLLTLYPIIDSHIPRKCGNYRWTRICFGILRSTLMIVVMSTVTGLFLLPIQWSVFRELSFVSILANLAVAMLGTAFLYAIPITLLLAPIPLIGEMACCVLTSMGKWMTAILGCFSEMNFAMLSLRYRFANIIIPLLALCMLILLLIRLRYKWLFAIPPVLAVACFATCLLITFHTEPPIVTDYTNGDQRLLTVTDNGDAVVCDLSCERSGAYFDAAKALKMQGATDVDALVLGHLSESHPEMLASFLPYHVVHRVYLPYSLAEADITLAKEIGEAAEAAGCEVLLYENEATFFALNHLSIQTSLGTDESLALLSIDCDGQILTYADPTRMTPSAEEICLSRMRESHTVWLAFSACDGKDPYRLSLSQSSLRQIVLNRSHEHPCVSLDAEGIAVYRYPDDRQKRTLSFFLDS